MTRPRNVLMDELYVHAKKYGGLAGPAEVQPWAELATDANIAKALTKFVVPCMIDALRAKQPSYVLRQVFDDE